MGYSFLSLVRKELWDFDKRKFIYNMCAEFIITSIREPEETTMIIT